MIGITRGIHESATGAENNIRDNRVNPDALIESSNGEEGGDQQLEQLLSLDVARTKPKQARNVTEAVSHANDDPPCHRLP